MSVGKRRRSHLRLTGFDYSLAAAYFVSVCDQGRKNLFGRVVKDKIALNIYGGLVQRGWEDLPNTENISPPTPCAGTWTGRTPRPMKKMVLMVGWEP
jgi:hypothetical protein